VRDAPLPRSRTRAAWLLVSGLLVVALSACGLGAWRVNPKPSPVFAVHAAVLESGTVLLVAGSGASESNFAAGSFRSAVWDPRTDTFTEIATPYDMFCSGHAFLPDGKLLIAGGTTAYSNETGFYNGSPRAYTFDPASQQYVRRADMASGKWYPTLAGTGDGRVLALGGIDENRVWRSQYQFFDPTTGGWSPERDSTPMFPVYPSMHLLRDGRYFYSGAHWGENSLRPGIWNSAANSYVRTGRAPDEVNRDQAASVLLPPAQDQRVMLLGGGSSRMGTATASTAVIDLDTPNPRYVAGPNLSEPKMYPSAVILPDRTVLQTNGSTKPVTWLGDPDFRYARSSQIYRPDTNTFQNAAPARVGRSYHTAAVLLPDGRVATFGGNSVGPYYGPFEMRIELYAPDYYRKPRPTLTVNPLTTVVPRGGTIRIAADAPLKWVQLVRPSAATHSSDSDQRLVDVPFVQDPTTRAVTATVDPNPYLTPPGPYMLFGVDTNDVPSVASWVRITG
jgi:hypothetical protein